MPTPISELIMQEVKTRLAVFAATAERPTQVGNFQPKHGKIVITQGTITPNPELAYPGNPPAIAWDMEAIVSCIIKNSDVDTVALDTYRNEFWSEIIKAANTGDNWHTWGGNAINSTISEVTDQLDEDGAFAGIRVVLLITFRTDENNPFNVRA